MRLLSVRGVLDRESDITKGTEDTFRSTVVEELDDTTTDYAMLSHRWSNKEVNYSEMVKLTSMSMEKRDGVGGREGYNKILEGCEQAVKDGLERLWFDTCCIDKRRSSVLSEAINSMYQWYYSTKCYAHLHDFTESTFPNKPDKKTYGNCNGRPEWFSWGWTLQELIAPKEVQFFNKDWVPLGNKRTLAFKLAKTTRIPLPVLKVPSPGLVLCGPNYVMGCRPEDNSSRRPGIFLVGIIRREYADALWRGRESISTTTVGNHPWV
ncbi:hypothetical protein EDC04DRAFT_235473 [Pisolithus marmoratus]|nr:hypothetical protein EDC04DRAFT_235473 [Pisolithus marmoratus]